MKGPLIPRFIGSLDKMDGADIIVAGFPYDCTSSFRSCSRFAAREIRSYSEEGIEDFSFYFGKGLDEIRFYDAGDLELMVGNPDNMVKDVKKAALELMAGNSEIMTRADKATSIELAMVNRRLVAIGGEHLITYPLFLATKELFSDFTILHLDAHADLREQYAGDSLSHSSVMNLCLQAGLKKLIQFGIRSGTRAEYKLRQSDRRIIPAKTIEEIDDSLKKGENIYLSVDLDFFDPGYMPGTGTPEAGGASFNDYIDILKMLKKKSVSIIGADVVELAPELDISKASTIFAAKLLRETLIAMGD